MANPEQKRRTFDATAPSADTDIFGSDISPGNDPAALRITAALDSASVLKVAETDTSDDTGSDVTEVYDLHSGQQLDAGELYTFDVPVAASATYNIQLGTSVRIQRLQVDEVRDQEV